MIRRLYKAIGNILGFNDAITLDDYVQSVRQQVPVVPRFVILYSELVAQLRSLGVEPMSNLPDYRKRYTDLSTLQILLPYLTYRADYYISELDIDCDDYARWAAADARRLFNIQGVWECWGDTPAGYHAFNIALTEEGFFLFEPNAGFQHAGELFRIGKYGYQPKLWR